MAVDSSPGAGAGLRARMLTGDARAAGIERLSRVAQHNLLLLDLVDPGGRESTPDELPAQVLGAFRGAELCGLAALRPSLVLESGLEESVLEALLPYFESIESGLVKSPRDVVDPSHLRVSLTAGKEGYSTANRSKLFRAWVSRKHS